MSAQLTFSLEEAAKVHPPCEFYPGLVCEIVSVHHPAFSYLIGERVVVIRVIDGERVWAHDDKPVTFRTNRNGQTVVDFDPRGAQTTYGFAQLRPLPGRAPKTVGKPIQARRAHKAEVPA